MASEIKWTYAVACDGIEPDLPAEMVVIPSVPLVDFVLDLLSPG